MTQRLPRGRQRRARHRARGRPLPGHRRSARPSATATRPCSSRSAPAKEKQLTQGRARPPQEGRRRRRMRHLVEFRDEAGELQVGETVTVEAFEAGQTREDLRAPRRARASRARSSATTSHAARSRTARTTCARRARSAPRAWPARVMKGIRGPGQMGNKRVTQQGLEIVEVDRRRTTCCSSAAPCPARAAARWRCAPMPRRSRSSAAATVDARRRGLRGAVQRPARARDRARGAERAAPGHRGDEDARQGPRRRREAVAPEGHRPRPRRLLALAASGRAAASSSARARATTPSRSTARRAAPRCAARCRSTPSAARSPSSTRRASTRRRRKQAVAAARATGASRSRRSCCSTREEANAGLSFRNIVARASSMPVEDAGVADVIGAASPADLGGRARAAHGARERRARLAEEALRSHGREPGHHPTRSSRRSASCRPRSASTRSASTRDAHKTQIRQAVEQLFDVRVRDVRTVSVKSKPKRRGVYAGRTRTWKKAIVQLAAGRHDPDLPGPGGD